MTDFKILDCTLRDGSYVNRFQFSIHETKYICAELEKCGLEHIEVGHGLGLGAYKLGGEYSAAASDEEYLTAASDALKKSHFGTFCIPGIATIEDIDIANQYGMRLIRIGTNVDAVESSKPYVERAKKYGMTVCANYMKSYSVPPREFAKKVKISESYGVDVIYLVDSAGGMLPSEVESYITAIKEASGIKIGFHGHNNLGLAVANSLKAIEMGAYFVDCSLQGLGRSGGNAPTEQFVLITSKLGHKNNIDIFRLLDLSFDTIL
ncbi:MAG TPA: 4-hydroxy-2-oxovalerate aldolase, partial [Victivallales bacterium]|nr:4-hydroxy-2-oxovalerate aldolase [Victivallales bacterium]